MSKAKCTCSNLIYIDPEVRGYPQETGFCIAEECTLNKPKFVTQAEAEKIGFDLQQEFRRRKKDEEPFPPSSIVFWILRKFNIRRLEGDLD